MFEEDSDGDENVEQGILTHSQQVYKHLIAGLLILFVGAGAALAGIVSLASLIATADELLAIKPENRADTLSRNIALTRRSAEKGYAELAARMEDDSIFSVNRQFEVMYRASLDNERDYLRLLGLYQQASFNVASRIRGSGEWYYYYERELSDFIKRQQQLETQVADYLSTLDKQE